MFQDDTRQNLLKVLEDLEKDLSKKNDQLSELEVIRSERDRIASLIHHIKQELGLLEQPTRHLLKTEYLVTSETSQAELSIITEIPLKEGISEIFDDINRPMEVNEIVTEFRKRQWKLSENNPQQVVRDALKRNPKLFRKVSRGIWEKIRRVAQRAPMSPEGGGS